MISYKTKGICSVIGASLLLIILGTIYTWSSINGYYVSYLKYHDSPNIEIVDGYFLMPLITILSNLFSPIGAYMEKTYGARLATCIGVFLSIFSHVVLLLFTQLWMVYFGMILFGMGQGFSYLAVIRNCWSYFPEKKGILVGFILAGFGLSSMVFTSICDYMVNPGGLVKPNQDGIYPKETAEKMHYYIFFKTCVFLFLGFLAIVLVFPFNPEEAKAAAGKNKTADEESLKQKLILNRTAEPVPAVDNEPLSKGFASAQFLMIASLMFCTKFSSLLIVNVNRTFGDRNGLSGEVLANMSKGVSFLNGTLRIVWGYSFDRWGFKGPFLIMIVIQFLVTSTIYFIAENEFLYVLANLMIASTMAGNTALIAPVVSNVFGLRNSTELYAVITIFSGVAGLIGPIFAKLVVKEKEDYLILFMIGAALSVLSLVVWFLFSEKKFDYGAKQEKPNEMGDEELNINNNPNLSIVETNVSKD